MAVPIPILKLRAFDHNGAPLAGGLLFSYLAGTTVPQSTYTDATGGSPNANPVVLDANGEADVWLGNAKYKFILQDFLGVQQWVVDNVDGTGSGGNSTPAWVSHAVTDGQAAAALSGETVDFATFSQAVWQVEIQRGTTVFTTGQLAIQNVNGTGRVVLGISLANEPNGVTFSISQASTVCTLKAALDSGAGNGTIKLSRSQVPK